ncbi:IS3 family transposase [Tepidibacter aestuarii]
MKKQKILLGNLVKYYNNNRIQLKLNKLLPIKYREQFYTE